MTSLRPFRCPCNGRPLSTIHKHSNHDPVEPQGCSRTLTHSIGNVSLTGGSTSRRVDVVTRLTAAWLLPPLRAASQPSPAPPLAGGLQHLRVCGCEHSVEYEQPGCMEQCAHTKARRCDRAFGTGMCASTHVAARARHGRPSRASHAVAVATCPSQLGSREHR